MAAFSSSAYATDDTCLPNAMPSPDVTFSAPKKIFAHYFSRFPLSLDNKPAQQDYYTVHYLSEHGEHDKWLEHGGFLRSRPLPVPPGNPDTYKTDNMKREVRLALSRGISGFTFDILSVKDIEPDSYLAHMLEATASVDKRFQIVLMPDMSAFKGDTQKVYDIVKTLYHTRGLYHLKDGRLVVAPFRSESTSPAAWEALKSRLAADGYNVAFLHTFLSLKDEYVRGYQGVSEGLGTFGTPIVRQKEYIPTNTAAAHQAGKFYMAGIGTQGYRPKSFIYWEAGGSNAYRSGWLGSIEGNADWVQLTTWNDFSESSQIAPYTDQQGTPGSGYFNLTGYYASWFITGKAPVITQDMLYYFYRKVPVNAAAAKDKKPTVANPAGGTGEDIIEVVGFLTAPATASITIGGHTYESPMEAGVHAFKVPAAEGTPHFALVRNNKAIISQDGATPIKNGLGNGHADLTYWSGSLSVKGRCALDTALLKTER